MKTECHLTFDGLAKHSEELLKALDEDVICFSKLSDFPYRKKLAHAALLELVEETAEKTRNTNVEEEKPLETLQLFTEWSEESDACGRPLATQSSDRCTTGEAAFIGDLKIKDLTHAAFVLSTQPHAKIAEIDTSLALEQEGVLGYISIKDIPEGGTNNPGLSPLNTLGKDDTPIFAGEEVRTVRTGAQEHTYMETQSCIAIPGEDDEWIIHSSSQAPASIQLHASVALGVPSHKIIVRVRFNILKTEG
ncbi:unnamed protein product [Strongylus vulgaris]|uniref:Aldehyde oxidase/xanthine dehydrogenase a/b hammerhead domain-containing protein n=1 Tax=Strongylus vulgaris TaxID=40348 RepID=A0A3P7IY43_STRVU|nr:unnamed protein product [Strongylus vulgaris]